MELNIEYKLKDPKRIQWLLTSLKNQHQLVTLSLAETEQKERTMIVDVSGKSSSVLLDGAIDRRVHDRISSGYKFSLATTYDGVDVRAEAVNAIETVEDDKGILYKVPFPEQLFYIQRRGNFRVSLAGLFKVPVTVENHAAAACNPLINADCLLSDMSVNGCLVSISDSVGDALEGVDCPVLLTFKLPESDVSISLLSQLRHSRYLERSAIWLAGFEFLDVKADVAKVVERLMVVLQTAARKRSRLD